VKSTVTMSGRLHIGLGLLSVVAASFGAFAGNLSIDTTASPLGRTISIMAVMASLAATIIVIMAPRSLTFSTRDSVLLVTALVGVHRSIVIDKDSRISIRDPVVSISSKGHTINLLTFGRNPSSISHLVEEISRATEVTVTGSFRATPTSDPYLATTTGDDE